MEDMQYYRERLSEIMKKEYLSKSVTALRIGINYMTLQKLLAGKEDISDLIKRKLKKFVDEYNKEHGIKRIEAGNGE